MRKLVSFNVSILIDDQDAGVVTGVADKVKGGMTEAEVWEECCRLYEEGIVEILEDEINVRDIVKVTVERTHD